MKVSKATKKYQKRKGKGAVEKKPTRKYHPKPEKMSEPTVVEEEMMPLDESDTDSDDALGMEKAMENLSKSDPKFFEFLKENDSTLLDFDANEELEDDEENVDLQDSEDENEPEEQVLSLEKCHEYKAKLEKTPCLKTFRQVLIAFKSLVESDSGDEEVFNSILYLAVKYAPVVFQAQIKDHSGLPSSSKKWKRISRLVKSFLTHYLSMLKKLTNPTVTKFMLQESQASSTFLACFPKLAQEYVLQLYIIWDSSSQEKLSILAFICLRNLASQAPPFLEKIFKGCYTRFLEKSRSTSFHTLPRLDFMRNCVVELSRLHAPTTYQVTFNACRQLAVQLRNAIIHKTKESSQPIYTWPWLHAVRVLRRIICAHVEVSHGLESPLDPMIYPLTQLVIGAIQLRPSARYFPFRIALIKELSLLMKSTQMFIPVVSYLLDMFESAEFKTKPKPSTHKPFDFDLTLKTPAPYTGTIVYRKLWVEETMDCLWNFFDACAFMIGFPEIIVPTLVYLRRRVKQIKDTAVTKQINLLIQKLEEQSTYIEQKRSKLNCSPKNLQQIKNHVTEWAQTGSPFSTYNATRNKVLKSQKKLNTKSADSKSFAKRDELGEFEGENMSLYAAEEEPVSHEPSSKDQVDHMDDSEDENQDETLTDGISCESIDENDQIHDFYLSDSDHSE